MSNPRLDSKESLQRFLQTYVIFLSFQKEKTMTTLTELFLFQFCNGKDKSTNGDDFNERQGQVLPFKF